MPRGQDRPATGSAVRAAGSDRRRPIAHGDAASKVCPRAKRGEEVMVKKGSALIVLAIVMLAGLIPLSSGCARGEGRYFTTSREGQPHVFRNRIHNPADYRYARAE